MAYTDYEYYVSGYLLGRSPAVSETEFPFWEKQAEEILDEFTFDRLRENSRQVTDAVQDCLCEITELLFKAASVEEKALEAGGAGPLASFSNDGESGTFDLSQSVYTEEGKKKKLQSIIFRRLGRTGLLYSGRSMGRCR